MKFDPKKARQYVDKFFTYATPHNGIEVEGINVPSWLGVDDISNFNRARMAEYLDLKDMYKKTQRVDWIPETRFPTANVFCMVGTNRMDYEAALGLSRTFVGHGSDGLVRIENATACRLKADGQPGDPCAKAYAFQSHSGYFRIVNSEEAFQNLARFFFGDVRVDIWVDIDDIRLPPAVQSEQDAGKKVNALYQFEVVASPRGKLWYLTRRKSEEDSVACLTHIEWTSAPKKNRSQYLSTVFLANRSKVNPRCRSLAYSMTLGVRTPDYEIDRKLWVNEHYEGGYLFRDAIVLELVPPPQAGGEWKVKYAWQGKGVEQANEPIDAKAIAKGRVEVSIDFSSDTLPGISGKLRFVVSAWNIDAVMDTEIPVVISPPSTDPGSPGSPGSKYPA